MARARPGGSASRGVMSRKRMPGFGKSGISRMSCLRLSIMKALNRKVWGKEREWTESQKNAVPFLLFDFFWFLVSGFEFLLRLLLLIHRLFEFFEGFVFELADALAGEADAGADFLERQRVFAA